MFFKSKKQSNITLNLIPCEGRDFYSNNDYIEGTVTVETNSKLSTKSLKVVAYGQCTSTVADVLGASTFNNCERHQCLKIEEFLIEDGQVEFLNPGFHQFQFQMKIPSFELVLPCQGNCTLGSNFHDTPGLPPSFKYEGSSSKIEVVYGVRAFLERPGSKYNLVDSTIINFVPSPAFAAFRVSHSKELPPSKKTEALHFSYKVRDISAPAGDSRLSIQSPFKTPKSLTKKFSSHSIMSPGSSRSSSSPVSSSPLSSSPVSSSPTNSLYKVETASTYNSSYTSRTSQTSIESTSPKSNRKRSFFGSSGSRSELYDIPISVSVLFNESVCNQSNSRGVLRHKGLLSEHIRLIFSTTIAPEDFFQMVSGTSNQLLAPIFNLSSLQIKLEVMTRATNSKEAKFECDKVEILKLKNLMCDFNLFQFRKMSSECRTWYQYEMDPSLMNCLIKSDIPSFNFCNAEREYQLTTIGELASKGCDSTKKFCINSDIVILG